MVSIELRRTGTRFDVRAVALALIVLAVFATAVNAQQYIGQNGRLLDANSQIGSGGFNATRTVSPLLSANAIATGNVGRGFSLRSTAPIRSPYTFRANLGSASLSGFRRDSVSVADSAFRYGGLTPRVYFDPSQTVLTPRFLGPQRVPTPSLAPSTLNVGSRSIASNRALPFGSNVGRLLGQRIVPQQPLGLRINPRVDRTSGLRSQIVGLSPTSSRVLKSSIPSGNVPAMLPPRRSPRLSVADSGRPYSTGLMDLRTERSRRLGALLDERFGTPLNLIIRRADRNAMLDRGARFATADASRPPALSGLRAFMDGEAIDIRRTDLMHQLERREDAELGFLLGYLEHSSGSTTSGLANLKGAAKDAPAGSFIEKFPALLTGERRQPLMLGPVGGPRSAERGPDLRRAPRLNP